MLAQLQMLAVAAGLMVLVLVARNAARAFFGSSLRWLGVGAAVVLYVVLGVGIKTGLNSVWPLPDVLPGDAVALQRAQLHLGVASAVAIVIAYWVTHAVISWLSARI